MGTKEQVIQICPLKTSYASRGSLPCSYVMSLQKREMILQLLMTITRTIFWKGKLEVVVHDEPLEEGNDSPALDDNNQNRPLERTTRSGCVVHPMDYYGY